MAENLKDNDKEFLRDIAVRASELRIETASGVVEAETVDGDPVYLSIIVMIEPHDTYDGAAAMASIIEEADDAMPSGETLQ